MNHHIAIILCAGYGTRMYPLTKDTPKPLLQVGKRPVLDYLMDRLNPIKELEHIYIITNDEFFSQFIDWKNSQTNSGMKIYILNDDSITNEDRLGAAGDLNFAFQNTREFSNALVAGGDNIFLFPFNDIWETFLKNNDHMIVALQDKNIDNLRQTGVLEISESNQVTRLYEKPETPPSHFFSPPLYFLKASAKEHLKKYMKNKDAMDASGHFVDYLCQRETVRAFKSKKGRLDIGNFESYQKADQILSQKITSL
jgi:glucose-1-phosphate thymidylyltransferase|tara:strand:- start:454 stop:1215 length:762 start_codon:yes stop_codon:yes gene_type:complete